MRKFENITFVSGEEGYVEPKDSIVLTYINL